MLPKTFSPSPQQGAASPELGPGATVAPEVQPAQNEYTLIIDRKEEKELLYRGGYKDVRDGNVHSYSILKNLDMYIVIQLLDFGTAVFNLLKLTKHLEKGFVV
jgi:hypothetical protein